MVLTVVVLNPILSHSGQTVLVFGPYIPMIGRLDITLEALLYGINMGIRMFIVLLGFYIYGSVVNSDRMFSLISRFAGKSILITAMAFRMVPKMAKKLKTASEAQMARGVKFQGRGKIANVKNTLFLVKIIVVSALEDSIETAESMYIRAYGSGPRSSYFYEKFGLLDGLISINAVFSLFLSMFGLFKGWNSFSFYPELSTILKDLDQLVYFFLVFISLTLPVFYCWGYKRWRFMKLKT